MTPNLTCPHCGTRNPPGSNFCNRCGAALSTDLEPPALDPAAPLEGLSDADAFETIEGRGDPRTADHEIERARDDAFADEWFDDEEPVLENVLFPDEQLVGAGYLESVAIAGEGPGAGAGAGTGAGEAVPNFARAAAGDGDHWRVIRTILREEPQLAGAASAPASNLPNLRPLWIVILVLLAAVLPFVGNLEPPPEGPAAAPVATGPAPVVAAPVRAAWEAIDSLSLDEAVLVLWQYDPATAGELDLPALPVISHMLERDLRSQMITLLPTGLASARRLYAEAVRGLDESAMKTVTSGWIGTGVYLTGGATALPLVASQAATLFSSAPVQPANPRLVVIVAARTDDVRQWLEIVQPVDRLPVVAVTTAAADPTLLPYVQSGQLAGLVSGFDGAAAYQSLRDEPLSTTAQRRQALVTQAQNWGALSLIVIALVANLARVFWRERRG